MSSVGFQRSKTATDKVEVVRVLATANQNRTREMEAPGQLEDVKCGVHRLLNRGLNKLLCQRRSSAAG